MSSIYRKKSEKNKKKREKEYSFDEGKIVKFLSGDAARPLTVTELGEELNIPQPERRSLRATLNRLVAGGKLIRIKGGRFVQPSKVHLVTGSVQITGQGDGYVTPETDGEEVRVAASLLGGAMNSDTVVVRVERQGHRGRKASGRVIRIIKRARKELVAYYEEDEGLGTAHPQDDRIGPAFLIPPGMSSGAKTGQLVVVRITTYPEKGRLGRGEVKQVLGDPNTLETQTLAVIRSKELPHRFGKKVSGEASNLPKEPSKENIIGRKDLRSFPFITIDGVKAKDFDDALFARAAGDGAIELYVSIADVSHYVQAGSAIDEEARNRGNSVYFPESVIPMLPERLSNGLCSLRPGEDKLSFTCQVRIGPDGNPTQHSLYESVIKSQARLTYRQVEDHLTGGSPLPETHNKVLGSLELLEEAYGRLAKRRGLRKSLDFDLPEPEVVLSITGHVENIYRAVRYTSHRLVEECMLLANEIVGEVLRESGAGGIYRVHEQPTADRIKELNGLLASLGYQVPVSAARSGPFRNILEKARGTGKERFLNTVILRSMMRAHYSPDPEGHFALALDDYAHFTSPIRRYADLEVHRILKGILGYSQPYSPRDITALCEHISETEKTAEAAHRDLLAWLRTKFMEDKVGQTFRGVVSAVTSFGFFVELEEFFIEGLVHLSALHDDYYSFHEDRLMLVGENTGTVFLIGDQVTVEVADVNLARRHVDFKLTGEKGER
ncbi:MAG: ribonuclease R [bacterium]|nr:ribonuclease R [bacterium]MDT8366613.1 ribonuclease R [bacterium]